MSDEDEESLLKPLRPSIQDHTFLAGFLSGKSCLTGGSHWWKFEFCFGKHVLQFHEEPNSPSRTEIFLGKWDLEKHKAYLDKNPHKKSISLSSKKQVVHYYTGGAPCDATGEPRIVEVKFKCVENPNPAAIALYLLEPKTCEYTLGVESSILCPLLQGSDDYGLFDSSKIDEVHENPSSEKIRSRKLSTSGEMDGFPLGDD